MSVSAQIGIDIGTTHSRVAIFKDERPQVVANELANNLTPSYVAYTDKLCHVGDRAKQQAAMNYLNTIYGVRRILGRGYDDPLVQGVCANLPYSLIHTGGRTQIQVKYRTERKSVTPEEIMALLIEKMVDLGKSASRHNFKKAIITVLSQFTCCQRRAVKDAAAIAGIDSELINESTAGAIAYAFEKKSEFVNRKRNLLVYNMGGGFTTATIVTVTGQYVDVKATAGDMYLGGDDFDQILADSCCRKFIEKSNIDLKKIPRAVCRLRRACEKAKKDLSFSVQAEIEVDDICPNIDFEMHITRAEFDTMCDSLFKKAVRPVKKVLRDLNFPSFQIDDIILVGGSTRMPRLQQQLRLQFDGKGLNLSINQDEAAVLGAAVLTSGKMMLQDVVPTDFGVENYDGNMDIVYPKNTSFPKAFYQNYTSQHLNEIIKVLRGGYTEKGNAVVMQQFEMRWKTHGVLTLVYTVDRDGILRVEGVVDRNRFPLKLPSETRCLTKNDISSLSGELERYRTHRFEDGERILAKDSKEILLGLADRLTTKLQRDDISRNEKDEYRVLRETVYNWLKLNTNTTFSDYENMSTVVTTNLAKIEQQYNRDATNLRTATHSEVREPSVQLESRNNSDSGHTFGTQPPRSDSQEAGIVILPIPNQIGQNLLAHHNTQSCNRTVEHSTSAPNGLTHVVQQNAIVQETWIQMIDDESTYPKTHKLTNKKLCQDGKCRKTCCGRANTHEVKMDDVVSRLDRMNLDDVERTRMLEREQNSHRKSVETTKL